MNDLDLPPRQQLPDESRDRLRTRVTDGIAESTNTSWRARSRAPIAVAAGVAILAAGAVLVTRTAGPDGGGAATQPPSSTEQPARPAPAPTRLAADDPRVADALARCGAVVEASPRAGEFAPPTTWAPAYGAEVVGALVVPYQEQTGKPGVCATTDTTVTVADPNSLTTDRGGDWPRFTYEALLYLPESGVLAGFAPDIESLTLKVTTPDGVIAPDALYENDLFVAAVGTLADTDEILSTFTLAGTTDGVTYVFDPTLFRPVGLTATDR